MGSQSAAEAVIMTSEPPSADERREQRAIANHTMNKPSPKLQPSHGNVISVQIFQP